jgi:cytochrome c oxidase subunit 2
VKNIIGFTNTIFFSLPERGSKIAEKVDHVFLFIFLIVFIIFLLVEGLLIYFAIKYRRRKEGERTEYITGSSFLEIGWTVLPLILVLMIFGYGLYVFAELRQVPQDAYEIRVTAKQWLWEFHYPQITRGLINELRVPLGRAIKLIMTSEDVIHSFFIPTFRVKEDVVPGRYTYLWFEPTKVGTYEVFCAEYCGTGHSSMQAKIIVMEPNRFQEWLEGFVSEAAQITTQTPAQKGKELIAQKGCMACHSIDGSPRVGPTFKGIFGRQELLQDGTQIVVDENYIKESIYEPTAQLVKGFPPIMPSFKGVLTDEDINSIIEYFKTLE